MTTGRAWIHGLMTLSAVGLSVTSGCGGETTKRASSEAPGAGGQPAEPLCSGEATAGCAGESADAGPWAGAAASGNSHEAPCIGEARVAAPTASTSCGVSVREVEPTFTCGREECAVTKALDLECETRPSSPWLSATQDGAVVMTTTVGLDAVALARLMTVTDNGARVEDAPELADPDVARPSSSIFNSAMTTSEDGATWLLAGRAAPLTALRESGGEWLRSRVLPSLSHEAEVELRDVGIVDDELGYIAYANDAPHLATWDGSCWSDQSIGDTWPVGMMALAVDDQRRPWTAWYRASPEVLGLGSLLIRGPGGETEDVLANLEPDAAAVTKLAEPLRMLAGGFDGTGPFPLLAARTNGGVALLSKSSAMDAGWRSTLLPEPAGSSTLSAHCPVGEFDLDDPCSGSTACDAEWNAVSPGFDLVRTASGATFAAWVIYSSNGTYALRSECRGGELPGCTCIMTGASGTGTADLVLMRLSEDESAPVLSHFRFDMGGPMLNTDRDLVMAARGDTLLVAAQLGGRAAPTLTYLEIDSSNLP